MCDLRFDDAARKAGGRKFGKAKDSNLHGPWTAIKLGCFQGGGFCTKARRKMQSDSSLPLWCLAGFYALELPFFWIDSRGLD